MAVPSHASARRALRIALAGPEECDHDYVPRWTARFQNHPNEDHVFDLVFRGVGGTRGVRWPMCRCGKIGRTVPVRASRRDG